MFFLVLSSVSKFDELCWQVQKASLVKVRLNLFILYLNLGNFLGRLNQQSSQIKRNFVTLPLISSHPRVKEFFHFTFGFGKCTRLVQFPVLMSLFKYLEYCPIFLRKVWQWQYVIYFWHISD